MPEDRFGDFGRPPDDDRLRREPPGSAPGKQARGGAPTEGEGQDAGAPDSAAAPRRERGSRAGERLAELDALEGSSRARRSPDRRSFQTKYTWVVGVFAAAVIVITGINSLPHAGAGDHGPPVGRPMPRFAAPGAFGTIDGTPNIKQGPDDKLHANRTAACDVHGGGVVNSCELSRKPLVLTFVGPGTSECKRYLDRIERIRSQFAAANFAAVVSGRSKPEVATLARQHGWTFPVAVDKPHVLFDLYKGFFCDTTFVYRGGVVRAHKILAQKLTDAELRTAVRLTIAGRPGGAR